MSSTIKVNNIQNLAGDDSGIDLSTNDQIILKTANTTAITVDSSQNTTLASHLNMGDNDTIKLGDSADLQIYHDGSNSVILDNGTGEFLISTNGNFIRLGTSTGEAMIDAVKDGASTLYHDNTAKLATASHGVSVGGSTSSKTSTGTIEIKGTSANQSIITNSDNAVSYANGATLVFGNRSGIMIVNNHGTGSVELFAMGGGAVTRFAGTSTTSGAVTFSSPNYVWTNDEGTTYTFTHTFIQTRNNV